MARRDPPGPGGPAPPLLPRRRLRRRRDRHLRLVLGRPRRVRAGRPGPRADPPGRRAGRARSRDEFSTPERPRWVAGSMGPGTKFPTLGQIPYADLTRRLRGAGARAARGRRRPPAHRDAFDLLSIKAAINGARRAMAALGPHVPLQVPGDDRAHRPHAARHRDRRRAHRARGHAGRRGRPQLRDRAGRDGRGPAPPFGDQPRPDRLPPQRGPAVGGRRQDALRPHARAAGRAPPPLRHRVRRVRRRRVLRDHAGPPGRRRRALRRRRAGRAHARCTSPPPPRSTPRSRSTRTPRSWSSASGPTPTAPSSSARRCSTATGTPASPWPATR